MHEKRLHSQSAFLTLTYDDAHLPAGNTLVKAHLQNFMKRLRDRYDWYANENSSGVRFFACGEYGEKSCRAHYHVLLLNRDLPDRRIVKSGSEYNLYESKALRELWPHGHHAIGDVTFESCAYVARYCMKKITGEKAAAHYGNRLPEFIVMSRRPGLGAGYFDKYASELVNHDSVIVNGHPAALPRYYDNKLPAVLPDRDGLLSSIELLKFKRRRKITRAMRADNSLRRLRVREVVMEAKLKQKARSL